MAVTLAQAALLSDTELAAGVLESFVIASPLLDRLPFMGITGNAYAYNAEATLPGVEFRAVNAAYSESTGTVVQRSETLTILGGDADVDTFIQRTRSNRSDQKAVQVGLKVKAAAYKMQDTFINGDVAVDANSFDGLKKRLTGGQVIDAGTNGMSVVGDGSTGALFAFMDLLDALIASVPGATPDNSIIYGNDLITARLLSASRRAGLANQTTDEFGKVSNQFRGYTFADIGQRADGTKIIPQTEVQGSSSIASSLYLCKFGQDETDAGITGLTNDGGTGQVFDVRDLGELQTKPAERTRIEGFVGMATFGGRAAGRLRGVLV